MHLRNALCQQKHCQLKLNGTERVQNQRRLINLHNSTGRKQDVKTTQLQTWATFHEKGKMTESKTKAINQEWIIPRP